MLKELNEIRQKQMGDINAPVEEAQKLLMYDEGEERRILSDLSPNSSFNAIENMKGQKFEMEKLEEKYGDVYTIEQIKEMAVTYRLRFLGARYYAGTYDALLASKIKNFGKEMGIETSKGNLQFSFFILAPANMFALHEKEYVTKAEIRAAQDPVLFYKIDDTHFRLIHKWGNDFSILRFITGWKWKNSLNHFIFNTLITAPIIVMIMCLLFPRTMLMHPVLMGIPTFILTMICAYMFVRTDEGEEIKGYYSRHNWNSTDKLK